MPRVNPEGQGKGEEVFQRVWPGNAPDVVLHVALVSSWALFPGAVTATDISLKGGYKASLYCK